MQWDFTKEFAFLELAQQLKMELRHCWYKDGRRESVAEHSWRLSLMILRLGEHLDQKVDILKCLKMAVIHDLPEAIAGDVPVTQQDQNRKRLKELAELEAMKQIKALLNDDSGDEIFALWMEFEEQVTYESKFIKALDKLEAFIQHVEAPLATWEQVEKQMPFEDKWLLAHCRFDSYLSAFAEDVNRKCIEKLLAAGENIESLRATALKVAA